MKTVGASVARDHFSALLREVELGNVVTITRHGRPLAKLVPIGAQPSMNPAEAIEGFRKLRKRLVLQDDWKSLRDAGRR